MIELLIKYIQDKGYQVDVLPGGLIIHKEAKGQIFSVDWMISKYDLQPQLESYLHDIADWYVWQIEEAIAQYLGEDMQFLEVGIFLIDVSRIVGLYADPTDEGRVKLVLTHPISHVFGSPKYIIHFDKDSPEAEQLLNWAKRRCLTL